MPKIPGVNHRTAVQILLKRGFRIIRESGHIIMSNGEVRLIIPRQNPINAIAKDAELTPEQFRALL